MPVGAGAGIQTDAGTLARRGEAITEVTATGTRTQSAVRPNLFAPPMLSVQQKAVLRAVRNLAAFSFTVILILLAY